MSLFTFRYVGSLSAMVYIFTLPAIIKMILKYNAGNLRCIDMLFYSILIILGTLNFIAQFITKE